MGRSDPIVFSHYDFLIKNESHDSVAFLGFEKPSVFTDSIVSDNKDFYDIGLKNWDINDEDWKIDKKYDLVVCTRCPYFSKNPAHFFESIRRITKKDGKFLVDWGLGDHWRFKNYKVGWLKDGEHEYAYGDQNFLWSTVWHDSFLQNPEFKKYQKWVEKLGYNNVKEAIDKEVPVVYDLNDLSSHFKLEVLLLSLWEESPQLYIMMLGQKI